MKPEHGIVDLPGYILYRPGNAVLSNNMTQHGNNFEENPARRSGSSSNASSYAYHRPGEPFAYLINIRHNDQTRGVRRVHLSKGKSPG